MFDHILVATDGSTLAEKGVASAIALAAKNHADILALMVIKRPALDYSDGEMAFDSNDMTRTEARLAETAQDALDLLVKRAAESGVRLTTSMVMSDRVADSIIDAAEFNHSDLIVMASHGRTALGRLFMGSETQSVLAHCKIPVLVVR